MNRNFGKENMEPQQPTQQPDHYGGATAEQISVYNRRVRGEEGDSSAANERTAPPPPPAYANPAYPTNSNDPRDSSTASRRYTISAAPGEGSNVPNDRHNAVPPHGRAGSIGADMMGNHSQRSIPGQNHHQNFRDMPGTPNQASGYDHPPISPTHFAHRMSLGQFYPMSGGASPNFPMGEMGDLSGRGAPPPHSNAAAPASGGTNGVNASSSASSSSNSGSATAAAAGGSMSQADHEEELLLNLLITRRQRSRMTGGNPKGGQQLSLADEIMRLRQGGGGSTRTAAPPVPGMPPLYAEQAVPNSPYPDYHRMMKDGYAAQQPVVSYQQHPHAPPVHPHMAQHPLQRPMGEMDRIDRSPGRFQTMDARMDMRDFSERSGYKRGYGMHQQQMQHHHQQQQHLQHHPHHMGYDMYAADMAAHGGGMEAPPAKKKRAHKKKPADMPRRPLSAYNLFFSEERERILKEIEKGEGKKEGEAKEEDDESKDDKAEKPKALLRPLIPSQKKRRPHRKTHGKISFQDLARMVGERWKSLPDTDRKYYQDLAQEDMKRQKAAMEEYYAKQNADKMSPSETGKSGETIKSELTTVDAR